MILYTDGCSFQFILWSSTIWLFFLTEQQLQVQERTALVGCVAAVAPAFNHFVGKSVAVRTVGCWLDNFIFCLKKQSRKFVVKDTKMTSQYEFSLKKHQDCVTDSKKFTHHTDIFIDWDSTGMLFVGRDFMLDWNTANLYCSSLA